jgi:hypothetical protein
LKRNITFTLNQGKNLKKNKRNKTKVIILKKKLICNLQRKKERKKKRKQITQPPLNCEERNITAYPIT